MYESITLEKFVFVPLIFGSITSYSVFSRLFLEPKFLCLERTFLVFVRLNCTLTESLPSLSSFFYLILKDSNNNGKNIENNIYKKSNDNDDSFIENKEDVKVVKSILLIPIRFMKKKDDSEQIKIYERM